jgi:hypothetical protein
VSSTTAQRKDRAFYRTRNAVRAYQTVFALAALAVFYSTSLLAAADAGTITFTLDFPNSAPEHYSIVVQADGHGKYESSGKISPDSDERDDYQTEFKFSDSTRARIFQLAAQAHYFSGKVDSGNKKLAFTGAKKLSFSDGQRNNSAEYNFSSLAPVQQLTSIFQTASATLEYGRRLTYFHRYQKLALDDELKRMEDQARRGEISEIQAVKPVLQDIYDDSSVINVVRARALRIMDMNPPPTAGN